MTIAVLLPQFQRRPRLLDHTTSLCTQNKTFVASHHHTARFLLLLIAKLAFTEIEKAWSQN
jgi:hypothetical protein